MRSDVSNVFGFRRVNGVFADVLRVIADPLEIPRDEEQLQIVGNAVGLFGHARRSDYRRCVGSFRSISRSRSRRDRASAVIGISVSAHAIAKQGRRFDETSGRVRSLPPSPVSS